MVMKATDEALTIEELTEIAREFLRVNYGLALEIPIQRNNRLRRAMGWYMATWDDEPLRIEIAGKAMEYGANEYIIGILRHELIHYALDVKGEPNDDGHPHFEAELQKHGAPTTNTSRVGPYVVYNCANCGCDNATDDTRVLKHPKIFATICCDAELINVHERIYNGTEAE